MRERIVAQNPGEARARERLGYVLRAIALLRRKAGDRAGALRDYQRAHAIYIDVRAQGYGGTTGLAREAKVPQESDDGRSAQLRDEVRSAL